MEWKGKDRIGRAHTHMVLWRGTVHIFWIWGEGGRKLSE
jgi:hypothetical protein